MAGYDNRLNRVERDLGILKWMVGVVIAMQIGTFWTQWQVVDRLAGIEARVTTLEAGSQASNAAVQVTRTDQ